MEPGCRGHPKVGSCRRKVAPSSSVTWGSRKEQRSPQGQTHGAGGSRPRHQTELPSRALLSFPPPQALWPLRDPQVRSSHQASPPRQVRPLLAPLHLSWGRTPELPEEGTGSSGAQGPRPQAALQPRCLRPAHRRERGRPAWVLPAAHRMGVCGADGPPAPGLRAQKDAVWDWCRVPNTPGQTHLQPGCLPVQMRPPGFGDPRGQTLDKKILSQEGGSLGSSTPTRSRGHP